TPVEHCTDVFALTNVVFVFQYAIHPTRNRNTCTVHWFLTTVSVVIETTFNPFVIDFPHF
ncbi:hypothetical protein D039_0053B, partial [Vibrio parahaemolyticus EKP-028]